MKAKTLRIGVILGLVALVSLGGVGFTATAGADTGVGGRGPGMWVTWPGFPNMWAGVYKLTAGGYAICVDPLLDSPEGTNSSDPYELTSWRTGRGEELTPEALAAAAYIAAWLPAEPTNAQAATVKLALMAILQPVASADFDPFKDGSDGYQAAQKLGLLTEVRDLLQLARSRAVTWDGVTVEFTSNLDAISKPGDVITASVKLPGLPAGYEVVFLVTKPDGATVRVTAVTDDRSTAALSYATAPDVEGTYTVSYQVEAVPPRYPLAIDPAKPEIQMMFIASAPLRKAGAAFPGHAQLRFPPTPPKPKPGPEIHTGGSAVPAAGFPGAALGGLLALAGLGLWLVPRRRAAHGGRPSL